MKGTNIGKKRSAGSYAGAVLGNAVLMVLLNLLPRWDVSGVLPGYADVLWAINLSLGVQIAGNLVLILLHPKWLHHLSNVIFSVVGIVAVSALRRVFPFDFGALVGEWLNVFLRVFLIVVLVIMAVSGLVHLFLFLRTLPPRDQK